MERKNHEHHPTIPCQTTTCDTMNIRSTPQSGGRHARGRRQGRQPLNPARGPLAVALPYGSSLLSVGERGRTPCRRPTRSGQKVPRFTVFCALPIFSHVSDLVAQDGSTWANMGLKIGQHSPQDGPT